MPHRQPRPVQRRDVKLPGHVLQLNLNAAVIDIGATANVVAVPKGRDVVGVRQFATFTTDLYALAAWLTHCGVDTVVMESTGVFWIPVFEILEQRGFRVLLVDARHVKNVSGRKSDVLDCQWVQQLHTYSLLQSAFRPPEHIVVLSPYLRQRAMLVHCAATRIQHMQKALQEMHVLLHQVVTDITGVTGLTIIRAIVAGERDPQQLAQYRNPRCKSSADVIAKSLEGNYREEHLYALAQAVLLYDTSQAQLADCNVRIEQYLARLECVTQEPVPTPAKKRSQRANHHHFDARTHLYQITGVDLTRIDGIEAATAVTLISEIGTDMRRWPTVNHFVSWLGLCPGTKVSGGRGLRSKTKPTANRAATALRIAASTLHHSRSDLGAFYRRMATRLGNHKP